MSERCCENGYFGTTHDCKKGKPDDQKPACPKCAHDELLIERRPNGDAICNACSWRGPYSECFAKPKPEQAAEVRPFLMRPAVIDWLQYAEFPEVLGQPDYPQLTLSLIEEYRVALAAAERRCAELEQTLRYRDETIPALRETIGKERERAEKAEAECARLKLAGTRATWSEVATENNQLRERIAQLELALKRGSSEQNSATQAPNGDEK